ncbi:MAG TPA: hypothetical protein VKR31_13810 [Rhizomicrobium sp.]|nr:hypothetical protein [Rhizomicrobium sp.]
MTEETELELAERNVREGEANVLRQQEIVAVLRRGGYTGSRPERLLAVFEASLAEHRKHLASLQRAKNSN